MSKYSALTQHLATRREARVAMTFADIERIVGDLPASARTHRPWWANTGHGHVQARGWMDAGFESQEVDLEAERLVFVRLNAVDKEAEPPPGRHPLFGCMKGTVTIMPGTDLTEPTAPDWDDQLIEKFDRLLGRKA